MRLVAALARSRGILAMFKPRKHGSYRVVPGEFYGTPKELWGFRTSRRDDPVRRIAGEFLVANEALLGLEPGLRGLQHQRTVLSLGAKHVILQQIHAGVPIHRAYVTVHVSNGGQ